MILYVVHGNTYYDGYGHIENIFGIYTEKYAADNGYKITQRKEKIVNRTTKKINVLAYASRPEMDINYIGDIVKYEEKDILSVSQKKSLNFVGL